MQRMYRGMLLILLALLFDLALVNAVFTRCMPRNVQVLHAGQPQHTNITRLSVLNNLYLPRYIVRAYQPSDVASAVWCAWKSSLRVCARSGGHSLAGHSLCPGVLIDVGGIRHIKLDATDNILTIGAGATLGEVAWHVNRRHRWFAAGVCPGVGIGGFLLGGGHGMYEGKLGITCDALVQVTLVTRYGSIITASPHKRSELFWAMCGAGGGQFGIVTEFKMRTVSSEPFDNAVVFKYTWPRHKGGELLSKWQQYDEADGNNRVRIVLNLAKSAEHSTFALGVCFGIQSIAECESRFTNAAFFNVPGRKTLVLFKARSALDVNAFFGPRGGWGTHRAKNLYKAMMVQRYAEAGSANHRTYHSVYLKGQPSTAFWSKYVDLCTQPGLPSIPWVVCEMGIMGKAARRPQNNAFPHRDASLLLLYIIGGGTKQEQSMAYERMSHILKPYASSVYVNYPQLQIKNYAPLYWRESLCRLRRLKSWRDPHIVFSNPQPIPPLDWNGYGACT